MISGSLPPDRCGVGDYTARLCAALTTEGCAVEFIASATAVQGTCGRIVARPASWRLSSLPRIASVLRRSDADVVHIQYPTAGYDAVWLPALVPLLARLAGKRAVVTFHEAQSWTDVRHPRSTLRFLLHAFGPGRIVTTRPEFRALLHPALRRLSARVAMRHIPIASNIGRSTLSEAARLRLRDRHAGGRQRLLAFFGFVAPGKGVEDLLAAMDPDTDRLLMMTSLYDADPYHRAIRARLDALGSSVTVTGYLPAVDVADGLAAADAVVLPFRAGASETNGTVHAAALQGTYVLTTTPDDVAADDPVRNVERVARGDVAAMRAALARHAGRRVEVAAESDDAAWRSIARAHIVLYNEMAADR